MADSFHSGHRSHRPQRGENDGAVSDLRTQENDTTASERRRDMDRDGPWSNEDLAQSGRQRRHKRSSSKKALRAYRRDDVEPMATRPEFEPQARTETTMVKTNGMMPVDYPRAGDLAATWHWQPPPARTHRPEAHQGGFFHVMPEAGRPPFLPRHLTEPPRYLNSLRDKGRGGEREAETSSARRRGEVD
ncbi:hypothetical protein JCM6882_004160 [Rhodosporidiobolus microsporus]